MQISFCRDLQREILRKFRRKIKITNREQVFNNDRYSFGKISLFVLQRYKIFLTVRLKILDPSFKYIIVRIQYKTREK